jgi:membrane protein
MGSPKLTENRTQVLSSHQDQSVGELVSHVSEQASRLARSELRLAQLEMAEKGKRAGKGAGMFGGAGLLALYGFACLVTTAILALAGAVSPWLAALIVGVALLGIAGVVALVGRREVTQATPPVPTETVTGIKKDIQALKPGSHS